MNTGFQALRAKWERFRQIRRITRRYRRKLGRVPNLQQPTRFTEKIQFSKLRWRSPRMVTLSDKVLVKDEVARLLGPDWITPTLYSGSQLPPRELRTWPKPYVIKVNHRSGGNLFIRSEADEDWDQIERQVESWLGEPHGVSLGEWVYTEIRPQVLVEPFIGALESPTDYKLFVFDGRVAFIHVHTDRQENHRAVFFDRSWQRQPFTFNWPFNADPIPRPVSLDEMIDSAERLASGFPFARVDLYDIEGRPRFGEVTFYPVSGFAPVLPDEYDFTLGAMWPDYIPD